MEQDEIERDDTYPQSASDVCSDPIAEILIVDQNSSLSENNESSEVVSSLISSTEHSSELLYLKGNDPGGKRAQSHMVLGSNAGGYRRPPDRSVCCDLL